MTTCPCCGSKTVNGWTKLAVPTEERFACAACDSTLVLAPVPGRVIALTLTACLIVWASIAACTWFCRLPVSTSAFVTLAVPYLLLAQIRISRRRAILVHARHGSARRAEAGQTILSHAAFHDGRTVLLR